MRGLHPRHGHCSKRLLPPNKRVSTEYNIWRAMRSRCENPRCKFYQNYGGRGIKVCERWLSFDNFLADMGGRPAGLTLDRIDNDKGYSPENCRWASRIQQARNTQRNTMVEIGGVVRTIADWLDHFGLSRNTFRARQRRGWDNARALSTPPTPRSL